jgi:hypothetical protein
LSDVTAITSVEALPAARLTQVPAAKITPTPSVMNMIFLAAM